MQSELEKQLKDAERRIQELEAESQELKKQATIDGLTGLLSRRVFDEILPREILEAGRNSEILSLIFMDLDKLKPVNDNLGHPAGDDVLRMTGKIIDSSIRKTDFAFRYGGDEFTILTPPSGAVVIATKISSVYKDRLLSDEKIRSYGSGFLSDVDISIGIVYAHGHTNPRGSGNSYLKSYVEKIVDAADQTMYDAKKNRSRIVIHSEIIS